MVIVASVSAIYGIGNPSDYHQMVMTLRVGDKMGQRDAIAQLVRMQYQRNEIEFARHFRVRGDTIDVFPGRALRSWRCASSSSTTRSRRCQLFDPLTGQIRQKIPRFTVYPAATT